MSRPSLMLLMVLVLCALSVVTSQHQSRKAFMSLQGEHERAARLDQEWRELQLEAQTLGTHARIEHKARALGMQLPDAKKSPMVVLAPLAEAAAK